MTSVGNPLKLRVDIVSDVVCPWCIIGYKQLQKALAELPQELAGVFEVTITWRPFELNPQMPAGGQDLREHLQQKYGSTPGQGAAARERLTNYGDALGFHFDYYDGMRMVNTFRAHQLLYWAQESGRQTALKMALFEAFFSKRKNVDTLEILIECAQAADLDAEEARQVLVEKRFSDAVRAEQELWRDRDVYAVPTFFFQDQYRLSGAQEAETFRRLLNKIHAREQDKLSATAAE